MSRLPTHVSALALMTIDLSRYDHPSTLQRSRYDHLHLVGTGMLSHRVRSDGRITFGLDTCAIGAGTGESALIDQLEDDLTDVGVLTAYNLQDRVLPLILSLTSPGKHLSLAALAKAPPERFCDLTQRSWKGQPVPFARACASAGIEVIGDDIIGEQTLWSFGVLEHMTAVLTDRAIATWRLWAARHADSSGDWQTCTTAVQQLDAWLDQCPLPTFDRYGRRLQTSRVSPEA